MDSVRYSNRQNYLLWLNPQVSNEELWNVHKSFFIGCCFNVYYNPESFMPLWMSSCDSRKRWVTWCSAAEASPSLFTIEGSQDGRRVAMETKLKVQLSIKKKDCYIWKNCHVIFEIQEILLRIRADHWRAIGWCELSHTFLICTSTMYEKQWGCVNVCAPHHDDSFRVDGLCDHIAVVRDVLHHFIEASSLHLFVLEIT